jgi:large-conductance mechanosensitive channel
MAGLFSNAAFWVLLSAFILVAIGVFFLVRSSNKRLSKLEKTKFKRRKP